MPKLHIFRQVRITTVRLNIVGCLIGKMANDIIFFLAM